jgi:hypothetical protein
MLKSYVAEVRWTDECSPKNRINRHIRDGRILGTKLREVPSAMTTHGGYLVPNPWSSGITYSEKELVDMI